ncbi:methyltransferase domain-containing protein [Cellulomonas soli]|uniref:methyltransferase domain-containing protein n=1 Tax=Cellulomonas soli TaxID=931535 RepID=UPI003F8416E0
MDRHPGRRDPREQTRTAPRSGPRATRVELTFLPGLGDVLADEITATLRPERPAQPVRGREDALVVEHRGPLTDVLALRTAVAAFVSLHFDVPRPRSLTSGDHLARIVEAVYASLRARGSSTFRFEAAGRDSVAFTKLAAAVTEATGLRYDDTNGELVLKVRRGVAPRGDARRVPARGSGANPRSTGSATEVDPGWDVLVRIGPRPMSARTWRVRDYPGAANATIAAAMTRLGGIHEQDRVLNLMSGSGTLLIERLLAGPAAQAVGVDVDPDSTAMATENAAAAGLARRTTWVTADVRSLPPELDGPFDLVLADPPWGTLHGSHSSAVEVHTGLLHAAYDRTAPGSRLVVLTHEITVMEKVLRDQAARWTVRTEQKVYAKGHHPRIYVLDRT